MSRVRQKVCNKKLKESSRRWLGRHLDDRFVKMAQSQGYRSRAAYKLIEMNSKYDFLNGVKRVIDLGAAPGGWSQVLSMIMPKSVKIVALDRLEMPPIENVIFIQGDFEENETIEKICESLDGKADVILSDMAPNTVGHPKTDHLRSMALIESVYEFASNFLEDGGTLVMKFFQGGGEKEFVEILRKSFNKVHFVKPDSSRSESVERFIVALGFNKREK